MIVGSSTQAAVEYMGVAGRNVSRTLAGFARDALDFIQDHPLLLVALVVLAIVFFQVTRPRTR